MNRTLINNFVNLVTSTDLGYNLTNKALFHSQGKRIAKDIANALNLPEGSYDIRSNPGGIAVSGEITLHGVNIYIQFSQSPFTKGFMYRTCKGRKDYTGGPNKWIQWNELKDFDNVIRKLKSILPLTVAA
jgi:hypothetical protein